MQFIPNQYPKPNMLIDEGMTVKIKGLQSEAGKVLNGKLAVAKELLFRGLDCRTRRQGRRGHQAHGYQDPELGGISH